MSKRRGQMPGIDPDLIGGQAQLVQSRRTTAQVAEAEMERGPSLDPWLQFMCGLGVE